MTIPGLWAAGRQGSDTVLLTTLAPASEIAGGAAASFWRRFRRNKAAMAGLVGILLLTLAAVLAPLLSAYDPSSLGPVSRGKPSSAHWFGTDTLGRDVYTRVLYGGRVSLRIAVTAVAIGTAVGLVVGGAAGLYGGKLDLLVMALTDLLLSFPYLVAAIVVTTVIGRGQWSVILVLGLLGWMPIARLFRAGVLQAKQAPYIEAARAVGCGDWRLMRRHLLPSAAPPVVVYATAFVGTAVLAEAALSFLGLGVSEPTPAWGVMVNQGRGFLFDAPHLLFFPASAIFVTVLCVVLVGDGLRDALDPRRPD